MLKLLAWFVLLPAISATASFVAQAAPSGGSSDISWTTILISYGVASPLVIYIIRDNTKKEQRISALEKREQDLVDKAMQQIPLQLQAMEMLKSAKAEVDERPDASVAATLAEVQRLLQRIDHDR